MPAKIDVHIRWMIRRDMPEVLDIEFDSFEFPWSEEDFIDQLRNKQVISMVAECKSDHRIVGYAVWEMTKTKYRLLNIAVHADCRGNGVGRELISHKLSYLSKTNRNRIVLEVRESNLQAQLFFSHIGFRCVDVARHFYIDTDEAAYVFLKRIDSPQRQPVEK